MAVNYVLLQDTITLRGEVFFPNLQFDKMAVDFGCILNDTEVTRCIYMTNTSPMEVRYHWSFVLSDQPVAVFHQSLDIMESEVIVEVLDNADADLSATQKHGEAVEVALEDPIEVDVTVEGPTESPRGVRTSSSLVPCT